MNDLKCFEYIFSQFLYPILMISGGNPLLYSSATYGWARSCIRPSWSHYCGHHPVLILTCISMARFNQTVRYYYSWTSDRNISLCGQLRINRGICIWCPICTSLTAIYQSWPMACYEAEAFDHPGHTCSSYFICGHLISPLHGTDPSCTVHGLPDIHVCPVYDSHVRRNENGIWETSTRITTAIS